MLDLEDVFELSLWGLELVVDEAAAARPAAPAPLTAAALRGAARVTDSSSPIGRLPLLTSEASRATQGRRAADAKPPKKK